MRSPWLCRGCSGIATLAKPPMKRQSISFERRAIDDALAAIVAAVGALSPAVTSDAIIQAINRLNADAAAARFHATRSADMRPTIFAIVGGTGTGKSTIVNRLLGQEISAASFRRTFTAGPIAIVHRDAALPDHWLGVAHHAVAQLPSRGEIDALCITTHENESLRDIAVVDTPDLDGDQPLHHAQADRAFRWADAVLFLVTPEKYQMTELQPYYRLATRYALPTMFAMNKADDRAPVDDYIRRSSSADCFVIPRDDAGLAPEAATDLNALRDAVARLRRSDSAEGLTHRVKDVLGRCRDQVIAPLRRERGVAEATIRSLRSMEAPSASVDVNPLTAQLRRRMQQRSVLYLMGPGRIVDRVRQMPEMLARLPRSAWDLIRGGARPGSGDGASEAFREAQKLDFRATLADQFRIVTARIDDHLRQHPLVAEWLAADASFASTVLFDPDRAGAIADDELAKLKEWLEKKWNATPRDTAILMKLVKYFPGGEKLTKWSETAPYLLAAVIAAHGAIFGHVDLMILGGYSLATWLSERVSNEVASRAKATNGAITQRFSDLGHEQIRRVTQWLDSRVPAAAAIDRVEKLADELDERVEHAG